MVFACILASLGLSVSQTTQVSGTVLDDIGETVIGASVVAKGTTIGTVTGIDGSFSLTIPSDKRTLVISLIGYKTKEVTAGSNIRVVLEQDAKLIDEVIVVAYGTTKRSSFTGSASTINSQAIDKRAITTVASALEGNSSGVQVTSGMGQPGESPSVRIRGFGSVNASSSPLYVVDGAVFNGSLADINPADIESITILKDAASTSLYGSSAGNGVMLITTKKGSNSYNVSLNVTQGWSTRAYKDYDRVNVWRYYPLQWEMLKNANISAGATPEAAAATASEKIFSTLKYNPYSVANDAIVGLDGTLSPNATLKWGDDLDWEDAAFGRGYRQEYNLAYNSSTKTSDTYSSIAYLKDKGYMLKTDYERYSARLNHNIYPVSWFKAGVNVGYTRAIQNYSTADEDNTNAYSNLTRFIRGMAPIYPVHAHDPETGAYLDADGKPTTDPSKYIYDYKGNRLSSVGRDGVAETEWNMRKNERSSTMGKTYITISPLEGLSGTVSYSLENSDRRRKVYENPLVGDGTAGPGRLNILSTRTFTQTFLQTVNYQKSIDKHRFDIMLGHENYSYLYEYLYNMKTEEVVPGIYDFGNFINISSISSYTHSYKKEGYFGRLNYDYDDKYYASVSYRRDGTSRFAKDNRWGNFWSFGVSWRITQENFMKDYSWIDNLKLRASYGETGNDAVLDSDGYSSYYPSKTLYTLGINNSKEAGVFSSIIGNPDLVWETQVSTDVALEFGLFNKLTGTIEYFNKESRDLLFEESLPLSTGAESILKNLGKSRNSGVEIDLNYNIIRNNDWRASAGLNVTFLKNRIVKLPEGNREKGIISGTKKLMEGHSRYEFWLRQWYGVDPQTGNGLYLLDTDKYNEKEGTMTDDVKKTLVEVQGETRQLTNNYANAKYDFSGDAIPDILGGFNFSVGYKDFDLSAVFSYSLGSKLYDTNYANLMDNADYGEAMSTDQEKAWRKPGDITDVPRLDNNATHSTSIGAASNRWLVSGDYLNLRSVALSYTVPKRLLTPMSLNSLRLTVNAENLFMLKARQGLNPQANFGGVTYNTYLPARTITFGLNLTF